MKPDTRRAREKGGSMSPKIDGYLAAKSGKPESANPHSSGMACKLWLTGYNNFMKQIREIRK